MSLTVSALQARASTRKQHIEHAYLRGLDTIIAGCLPSSATVCTTNSCDGPNTIIGKNHVHTVKFKSKHAMDGMPAAELEAAFMSSSVSSSPLAPWTPELGEEGTPEHKPKTPFSSARPSLAGECGTPSPPHVDAEAKVDREARKAARRKAALEAKAAKPLSDTKLARLANKAKKAECALSSLVCHGAIAMHRALH